MTSKRDYILLAVAYRQRDNASADGTSAGKSFQIRGPTTGKARTVGDSWRAALPDG